VARSVLAGLIVRRCAAAVVFVMIVACAAFLLVRLAPGDAATDLQLRVADPAVIAATRARLGLDQPLTTQFGRWLVGLAHFDLGQSSTFGRPVASLVTDRLLNTAQLAGLALVLATLVGLPLGVMSGARPDSWLAKCVTTVSLVIAACPPIIATLILLWVALLTGWLSVRAGSLALPVIALAAPVAAMLERLQSQSSAEAAHSTSVLAAAARGVPSSRLTWIHATRQSLRPVLGVYGVVVATLFSGSIAVETITDWPGLGRLTLEAVQGRDLFLVSGCALAGAVLIAASNLAADLLRLAIDPRLRSAT
jgi:ABC-type dipeptide/oligopeptide/nickel transport system permease component